MISVWLLASHLLVGSPAGGPAYGGHPAAEQAVPLGPMLEVGEELEYSVRYSFFDIGTIRFRIISKELRGDRPVYRALVEMQSNPGLRWLLNLNIKFFGLMDTLIYSHTWMSEDSTSDKVMFRSMVFDYSANRMYYTKGERLPKGVTKVERNDTVAITGPSQDGMSLFFFAREYVLSTWSLEVPTYMDTEEASTKIRFTGQRKSVKIDAVKYPVETVYFDGKADFVGVFGVTGEYEGWFSNDAARIPILARMKVLLGSVEIQLTKWKRSNWSPPRYVK